MSEAPLAAPAQARPGARGAIGRAAWIALALVAGCCSPAPQAFEDDPSVAARVYQVFFDWNSARLTDEASTTLAGVAGRFDAGRSFQIEITGHADPREDGPDLNRRRAQAVRARLVRLGIAAQRITVASAGVMDLGDPMPGPAEPQHRRAQIERR